MPKINVTKVTLTEDKTVKDYSQLGGTHGRDFKELLKGVKDTGNWTVEIIGKPPRVKAAHPEVNGHPGHTDPGTKGWKLYVERGKRTVDRLFVQLEQSKCKVSAGANGAADVEIAAKVWVAEDTH